MTATMTDALALTISRDQLQAGLGAVASTVPSKTTLPVLANVLLQTTERGVRLTTTDLDIAIVHEIEAEIEGEGAITLPAKKLVEMARELPNANVSLTTNVERATIKCGSATFKLTGIVADEFPTLPTVDFSTGWRTNAGSIQTLAAHTGFAVSTEESRPILNGVLIELRPDSIRMVATNGHRLAQMVVPTAGTENRDLIVPPKALDQIRRLFSATEEITVAVGTNHIAFQSATTTIYSRLIEGPYPNYRQVIPADNTIVAVVDKAALTASLKRMSVMANDQTHRIRLAFADSAIKLSVETSDLGEATDETPLDSFTGEALTIGFNSSYLLEVLRYQPTPKVKLTFKSAERAATVEPVDFDSTATYMALVMPLRLVD